MSGGRTTIDRAGGRLRHRIFDIVVKPTALAIDAAWPLTVEKLERSASLGLGTDDFGEPPVEEPLERILQDLREEDTMSDAGRLLHRLRLRATLRSRLQVVEHLRRHPEVAAVPLRAPIFIVGLPRTGTTLLQNLLAAHPDVRALEGWESLSPLPDRPEDARRREWRVYMAILRRLAPDLTTVHPMELEGPEECVEMIDRTLYSGYLAFFGGPRYAEFYDEVLDAPDSRVLVDAYRLFADQLRMQVSPGDSRRLLVKSPALIGLHDVLAELMPGATFITTHRDLREVIPSALSLAAVVRTPFQRGDPALLGPQIFEFVTKLIDRVPRESSVPGAKIVPVRYPDLVASPGSECARLFDELGLEPPGDIERFVAEVEGSTKPHRHGRHVYELEQFGVSWAELDPIADAYADEFGLGRESVRD